MALDVTQSPADRPITGDTPPTLPWVAYFAQVRDILSALTLSGTTAERPTKFLWVGRPYWDETLQALVVLSSADPNVWKLATPDQVFPVAPVPTVPSGTASPQAEASNLLVNLDTLTNIVVTADEILLKDSSGNVVKLTAVLHASSMASVLDGGSIDNSTWYYVWLIWNGTISRLLISSSAQFPHLPVGFTHKGLLTALRINSSGALVRGWTQGRETEIAETAVVVGGNATASTAVSVNGAAPPNGRFVRGWAFVDASAAGVKLLTVSLDGVRGRTRVQENQSVVDGVSGYWRTAYTNSEITYSVFASTNSADINVTGWEF